MRPIYYIKEIAFQTQKFVKRLLSLLVRLISNTVFAVSFLVILLTIYRSGFTIDSNMSYYIEYVILSIQIILFLAYFIRLIILIQQRAIKRVILGEIILLLILSVFIFEHFVYPNFFKDILGNTYHFFESLYLISINAIIFLIEFSKRNINFFNVFKPPLLFLLSFVLLIMAGGFMLLLPTATTHGISVTNAFFTSTSAVCVTGLTPIDTATSFTFIGKTIILFLIQLGGLGIMTFTTFFGLFFSPSSTFRNQLMAKEISNSNTFSDLSKTLFKIILFTFIIEGIGAFFIWLSLGNQHSFSSINFAVFHSISAFCNAGFSSKSMNLMDTSISNNYSLQFIVALLIILGGIGFPILLNYYKLLKHFFFNMSRMFQGKAYLHKPRIININSRIVIFTTLILIMVGMAFFILFENNHILQGHSWLEKMAIAFFASVTPRTAGFNTFDYSQILPVTALFTILLMWIGASPGSTGGGIKTSTFAIAILHIFSFSKGKNRIEISHKEVSSQSVGKAFIVIFLSLLVIGISISLVSFFNPNFDILKIAFECFSAFGTVGLSMGITSHLADASKWVLIVTMFLGRVGTFTLFVAFIRKVKTMKYKYPVEEINI